jgi:uncharacterized protein YjbI with pentapeptide repeats
MKKILKDIIQNQSEFTIDSRNFANEILVDEMINGSNFYVIKLSVCQFQNCDIVYGDFLKCRFKDCIFNKGLWRKSNFEDCVFENCTFVGIKFSRAEFIDTTFIDCTFDNLYLASSRFRDCDLESNNFINLKWDPQNPVIVSNSKTSIGVTDSESFQEAIILD